MQNLTTLFTLNNLSIVCISVQIRRDIYAVKKRYFVTVSIIPPPKHLVSS